MLSPETGRVSGSRYSGAWGLCWIAGSTWHAGRQANKVSEPVLVSHCKPGQPLTHSHAPTRYTVMPISPDDDRRESTHEERIWVIQLQSEGHSYCKIQQQTGDGNTAVHHIFNKWNSENTVINRPHSGRPKQLPDYNKWHLQVLAKCYPHSTLQESTADSGLNCSIRLVGDTLRSQQWRVRICRHKSLFTPANQLKRKWWARQYSSMPVKLWKNKIYSDEVHHWIGSMPQGTTVRWNPGAALEHRNLAPTFKQDFETIQFFAGISSTGHTPLVPIRQRQEHEHESNTNQLGLNSSQYVKEVLVSHVLPLYEVMGGSNAGVNTIENGDSYHTSAYTLRWRLMNEMIRLDWAPHSPDMNTIENVWSIWKVGFRKVMRDPNQWPHGCEEVIAVA